MVILKKFMLAVSLGLLFAGACPAAEKVVARVNGSPVSSAELELETGRLSQVALYHRNTSEERMKAIRKEAFDNLVIRHMIYAEALSRGYREQPEEITGKLNSIRKKFASERDFEKALQTRDLTPESLRTALAREAMEERFLRAEIDDKAVPAGDELKDFFAANRQKFRAPEKLRVFNITVGVPPSAGAPEWERARERAEELVKRIRSGEDMSALARTYSTDAFRDKGGDLGLVHRGRLELPLEEVAFSLKEGETGGPVKTMYGYNILQVRERLPERDLDYEEAKPLVEKQFSVARKQELRDRLMAYLRGKYVIVIEDPAFR